MNRILNRKFHDGSRAVKSSKGRLSRGGRQIIALQHDSTMLGSLFIDLNRLHRQFFSFRFITREKQFSKKGKLVLVEKLWMFRVKVKYHSALEMCESCCRLRRRKKNNGCCLVTGGREIKMHERSSCDRMKRNNTVRGSNPNDNFVEVRHFITSKLLILIK